ncbi:hypothetical protein P170DRAFT_511485 [Aspergillus steynii IBT 23096]|uniref:BZIP domain-containing protein n=1 Tax=Aspergillus steynii IBT 23096 TaxID=1392250 RepID=A0A2I2G1Q4_9EURO|nr:uncharacterized protein P170DRAFT_511485 [Aspergillus steynii IBT 23096]PLB46808.1 hypothetical protein P170DRAFT_511485 [Aspergillus steynii IBT 23096]
MTSRWLDYGMTAENSMDLPGASETSSTYRVLLARKFFRSSYGVKIDRLARVRENQRKSRAKKQEHVRDLEQKLASFQERIRRQHVEHRLAVQRLEAENAKLKHLLAGSGLTASQIDGYLQADSDPAMAEKIAIPPIRGAEAGCGIKHSDTVATRYSRSGPVNAQQGLSEQPGIDGIPDQRDIEPSLISKQDQSICGCTPAEDEKSWPTNEDILNTTLCALAEELINQYNTCGVDMAEIRRKLWSGFSKGLTTDEGCRVQNQILFQVLDEISNN